MLLAALAVHSREDIFHKRIHARIFPRILSSISDCKRGGYFFFDLPSTLFFQVGRIVQKESAHLNRFVDIAATEELDIYSYHERCSGVFNGNDFSYEEEFKIRYWKTAFVEHILNDNGFIDTPQTFPQFNSTGSTYKLFKKI